MESDRTPPCVSIRLEAGAPSFVFATDLAAPHIPSHLALRCDLLRDLPEEADDSNEDFPLPLSVAELKAWAACALEIEAEDACGTLCGSFCSCAQDVGADLDRQAKALKVRTSFRRFVLGSLMGTCCRMMRHMHEVPILILQLRKSCVS